MKMKSFLILVLTLVLAGCANEELETLGGGGGSSPGVSSGQTVLFSNNTAVTIGDTDGVRTRAMGWTAEVTDKVNDACWLAMDVKPIVLPILCTLSPAKQWFIISMRET